MSAAPIERTGIECRNCHELYSSARPPLLHTQCLSDFCSSCISQTAKCFACHKAIQSAELLSSDALTNSVRTLLKKVGLAFDQSVPSQTQPPLSAPSAAAASAASAAISYQLPDLTESLVMLRAGDPQTRVKLKALGIFESALPPMLKKIEESGHQIYLTAAVSNRLVIALRGDLTQPVFDAIAEDLGTCPLTDEGILLINTATIKLIEAKHHLTLNIGFVPRTPWGDLLNGLFTNLKTPAQ